MNKLNVELIKVTGKQDNKFVGLKIENDRIEFYYPESYTINNQENIKELREDILAILNTISLARTYSRDNSTYNTEFIDENISSFESYQWMILDYLSDKKYYNQEKNFINGTKGKINWKKTMKSLPIISKGNVIYNQIISEKNRRVENIITEIYMCCVCESIEYLGWLYGISKIDEEINYKYLLKANRSMYLSIINNEICHTFQDEKKLRLIKMRNILTGLDANEVKNKELIYGVDSYDYVFERMIDDMFSNINDIKEFYPKAKQSLILDNKEKESTSLRPDTIAVKDNEVFIIDAKNYRYGSTFLRGDLPETTSVQKQVTYGEYVRNMKKNKYSEIYSAFIMPYSKINNEHNEMFNKNFEFIGISKTEWYNSEEYKNRKIVNVLIDMKYLINNWKNKNNDNIEKLIELIKLNVDWEPKQ